MTDTPMKRCPKCGEKFPATAEYFHRNKSRKDNLSSYCSSCNRAYNNTLDRDAAARRATERQKLDDAGLRRCSKCGEIKPATPQYFFRSKWSRANLKPECKDCTMEFRRRPETKQIRKAINRRYYTKNPLKNKMARYRRKYGMFDLPHTLTPYQWYRALRYFNFCCAVCGRSEENCTFAPDHWIPLSKGGGTTRDNIVPLCHGNGGCNNKKYNLDAETFLVREFGEEQAQIILERISAYFASLP